LSTDARQRLATLSVEERNALAQRLFSRRAAKPAVSGAIPRRSQAEADVPLSYAQQRFWLLNVVEPVSAAYNVTEYARLRGPLATAALQRALDEVIGRHEVLRTTFHLADTGPVQRVLAHLSVPLELVDVGSSPDPDREIGVRIAQIGAQPWDLRTGPLVRAALLRIGPEEHVLFFLLHHIIADGWAKSVFVQEIADAYAAYAAGREPALPEPPIQYADYSLWQRQWMQGDQAAQQLAFWKRYMADAPTLHLPSDRMRARSGGGTHHYALFPEALTQAARSLAQREGVTMFMLLLAAFGALLARYADQQEVVIGSPTANRIRPELENLLGCFMNPVPLRVDARQNPSFRQLLARVREGCLGAFANQEVPFDHLVRTLQPRRDASVPPLFQSMLLLHNFLKWINLSESGMQAAGFNIDAAELARVDGWKSRGDLIYPVALEAVDLDTTILGRFEYADAYATTLANLPSHFLTLLSAVTANPELPVFDAQILSVRERETLLTEWNHDRREYPAVCAHQLFEAQVRRAPDNVAVVAGDESASYGDLNANANRLARHLRALGATRANFVGVLLHRSTDLMTSLMAVLKTGAAYVPLDPAYPANRLAFVVEDTAARLLITTRRLLDELPELGASLNGVRVVCLDEEGEAIAAHDPANPEFDVHAADVAYVIHTSGSTGVPKGVCVQHGAIANYVQAAADGFEIGPADRVLQFASISFDTAAEEIYPCLSRGGALVLRSAAMIASAPAFLHECGERGITVLDLPTAYWHELTSEICQRNLALPESIRLVILGGEEARPDLAGAWQARFGERVRLLNTYGPTETTVVATTYELPKPSQEPRHFGVPIGRPIPGARTYILDVRGNPSPVGVPGELHIGGSGLAMGYLNRPDLTAASFVPDPFGTTPGARLYRTGDLARYLGDGTIEFLGRADRQVKLHGFRIEPGEVEAVLMSEVSVAQAAVIVREDRPGDRRLVAYVVAAPGASANAAELRRLAKSRLPEHMVPSAVVELARLPLTPNGKLDSAALPAPDGARQTEQTYVAPRTDLERRIAAIWCEVLGIQSVGVADNFFDLGGHSMLVVRLHARLSAEVGGELTVVDIFRLPTVAALARQLTTADEPEAFADAAHDRARKQREAMARRRKAGTGPGLATL
jgi:amino acid adenylation domain-containing protein